MATIRAYTTLEQSRKLATILPLESADMFYTSLNSEYPWVWIDKHLMEVGDIPCWSVAALIDILPKIINDETLFIETSTALWHIGYRNTYTVSASNTIDACYELIVYLHELNLL
jgi:hypothetical protein